MLRFVCDRGVRFVTTSAGSPAKFIAPLHDAGIVVYHAVPTLDAALKCVDAGVDGLVVEGSEGGGFKNPEEVSTLVLLQARARARRRAADRRRRHLRRPRHGGGLCAGRRGHPDGHALRQQHRKPGACALQRGHRRTPTATGTWVLNKKSTPCIRALKTQFTATIHEQGLMPPDAFKGIRSVYFDGDMDAAPALAGQSAGLIDEVKSVQAIIDDTVAGFHAITRPAWRAGPDGAASAETPALKTQTPSRLAPEGAGGCSRHMGLRRIEVRRP